MRRTNTNGFILSIKTRFTDPGKFADPNWPIAALRSRPISDDQHSAHHHIHTVLSKWLNFFIFLSILRQPHVRLCVLYIWMERLLIINYYIRHDRHWKYWEILLYQSRARDLIIGWNIHKHHVIKLSSFYAKIISDDIASKMTLFSISAKD